MARPHNQAGPHHISQEDATRRPDQTGGMTLVFRDDLELQGISHGCSRDDLA